MLKKIIPIIIFANLLFGQYVGNSGSVPLNGEKYITGDDGVVRMYVSVWGHVKVSGTFLIFDGADVFSALSLAGGPLEGADLDKIRIISKEKGNVQDYNINDIIQNKTKNSIYLAPYDTIVINQTRKHKILTRSSLISAIFQLLNLAYTIDKLGNDN